MSASLKPAVNDHDHIEGNVNAPVELVEYGDYQCPHCGHAYGIVKKIQDEMGDKLKFVFRNFPLSTIHPNAMDAAIATEAAGLQGKFWKMHDIIFENQEQLEPEDLLDYANTIGLDIDRFANDSKSTTLAAKAEQDFESGIRSGVNSTPSFFINGVKFNGGWESANFMLALRAALEEKERTQRTQRN